MCSKQQAFKAKHTVVVRKRKTQNICLSLCAQLREPRDLDKYELVLLLYTGLKTNVKNHT